MNLNFCLVSVKFTIIMAIVVRRNALSLLEDDLIKTVPMCRDQSIFVIITTFFLTTSKEMGKFYLEWCCIALIFFLDNPEII